MSATIRRYIAERENHDFARGENEVQEKAGRLRRAFLKRHVIGFDTNLYKTQEERDWTYIAKREYIYDVQLTGIGYSVMLANLALTWRGFVQKRLVLWPLAIIPIAYFAIEPVLLQKHSKKLFDMCNLGEEFFVGQKRNQVLRECNQILGVEDF